MVRSSLRSLFAPAPALAALAALATLAAALPAAEARRPMSVFVPPDEVDLVAARAALYPEDGKEPLPARCAALTTTKVPGRDPTTGLIHCMIAERYQGDPKARALALALYQETGNVAGLGEAETMDGGYRGDIKLVPQLPTGEHRKHLAWVAGAAREFDAFFAGLELSAPDTPVAPTVEPSGIAAFRWRGLSVRFVRSVAKRTPSAYAIGWSVTYNVRGSLLTSAAGVTETLFHEIFHLNDAAHDDWSATALRADYDAILARCQPKLTRACLARYAPGTTTVKGGTYYAFQQNNGDSVHEYAAELALRYYKEHRELAATGKLAKPAFKCGAPENARAWKALVDEFFAGVDRTGDCR